MKHRNLLFSWLLLAIPCLVQAQEFYSEGLFKSGLARAKTYENDAWGFINPKGKWVITARYEEVQDFSEGLAAYRGGNGWGFINTKGYVVIEAVFQEVLAFKEGLAAVKTKNKWGFIDPKGTLVIPAIYTAVHPFSGGLAAANTRDEWGFLDKKGDWAIQPKFLAVRDFSEGRAFVNQFGTYGWVDSTGTIVIPHPAAVRDARQRFESGFDFHEGIAAFVDAQDKVGFLDKNNQVVIAPKFATAKHFFNGVALVQERGYWALINREGAYVLNDRWIKIMVDSWPGKLLPARPVDQTNGATLTLGYLNLTGKWAIPAQFERGSAFSEGKAAVMSATNHTYGYINERGKWVIKPAPKHEEAQLEFDKGN